jgi:hypothetical protein
VQFRDSNLVRVGVAGLVLGTGPLLLAVGIAHLHGDSNPNPVGPGILAGVTFWPSLICLIVGVIKVSSAKKALARSYAEPPRSFFAMTARLILLFVRDCESWIIRIELMSFLVRLRGG